MRALITGGRDVVYPEDIQALARNVFGHRINLKSNAKKRGVTVENVIDDVVQKVAVP